VAGPGLADAGAQVQLLISLVDRLELGGVLKASRRFLARERELNELIGREQLQARQRRAKQLQRLVTSDVPPAVPLLLAELAETDAWLDMQVAPDMSSAEPARAVALLREAARVCRGHAAAAAQAEGPDIHAKLQKVAAETVAAVAAVKPLPRSVWAGSTPIDELIRSGREGDLAVLVRAQERFARTHELAVLVRQMGSLGAQALLPDGAPDWGYAYRQWAKVDEMELKRLAPPLRLRWAHDHDWQPGLWLADDLVRSEPEPAGRSLLRGFLIPSPLRQG
jgi:hypothetical protein